MFSNLRNKFIAIIMLVSTSVLLIAFSAIYLSAAIRIREPHPMPDNFNTVAPRENEKVSDSNNGMAKAFEDEIHKERAEHLKTLLVSLIFVGIVTEALVFVLSILLVEKAIAPVKHAYENQREFIANASHELKTPIAAVQANFEALGATEQPWVNNIETELNRANNLVKDLLTLARTDGRMQTEAKEVDLVGLIRRRTKLAKARLGEKELELDLPKEKIVKLASSDYLQIVDILIDNAIKYSEKKIVVSLKDKTLRIMNDGKKIPAEKGKKIFDRFYQVDKTAEGSGLGLSIAKAVADKNKWKLALGPDDDMTCFELTVN